MKRFIYQMLFVAIVIQVHTACNSVVLSTKVDETQTSPDYDPSLCILRANNFQWEEEGNSRTSITINGNIPEFSWTVGDSIGILPDEGAQVYFTIPEEEEGETNVGLTASFDGGAWALKAENNYAAYYPFVKDFDIVRNAIPVVYSGQKQTGNNSSAHLGAFDYNATHPTTTSEQGGVNFGFDHVGALARLKFTVPTSGTVLNKVELVASRAVFILNGTYNLTNEDGFPVTATDGGTSKTMTLNLDYTTQTDNEEVTVYFMCAPVDLTNYRLTLNVKNSAEEIILSSLIMGRNMLAGHAYGLRTEPPYLTFSANEMQKLSLDGFGYSVDESLQYSVGNSDWKKVISGTVITFGGNYGNIRFRGKSSTGTAINTNQYARFSFTDANIHVTCSGDIRTLIDWENYASTSTSNARFCNLFLNCKALKSIPEGLLPAQTLAEECYYGMFINSGLTSIPENLLPAQTLTNKCYYYMFWNCTGLSSIPANLLPAKTLADDCYGMMFRGCTGLSTIPEGLLPAQTLANKCYRNMFYSCTGLSTIPEGLLPAKTLAENCYYGMFWDCKNLSTAPALQATTIAKDCYSRMFYGCEKLSSAPSILPADTLAENCYNWMFYECTALTSAPKLPATTLANSCYNCMFYGCKSLTSAPALPAKTLVTSCYNQMFYECSNLNNITMMATSGVNDATNCLSNWVYGVSNSGTFTKSSSMNALVDGANGIPSGWTVIEKSTGDDLPGMGDGGNYNE